MCGRTASKLGATFDAGRINGPGRKVKVLFPKEIIFTCASDIKMSGKNGRARKEESGG